MSTLKENEIDRLIQFVKQNYGINLEKKHHLIQGRLGNLAKERGYVSFHDYLEMILHGDQKEEHAILLNKLTTNHTYFMREEEHFAFFGNVVLPQLKRTVKDRDLRIWSAGCSSGEEAYTLAMTIKEVFGREASMWDSRILATDVCQDVLQKAVSGRYSIDSMEQLSPVWRSRYFERVSPEEFTALPELKKEIFFRIFNLMDEFPFKRKFHVIFCRNVMIYFDQQTKDRLIQKFYDMTEEGGYLFIGMSETIPKGGLSYKYVMPSIYKKG